MVLPLHFTHSRLSSVTLGVYVPWDLQPLVMAHVLLTSYTL